MTAIALPPVWGAAMIHPDDDQRGAPLLRREFDLDAGHGTVRTAELHISALGVFEAVVNGFPVGDELLAPGWSSYEWRLRYRSFNVAAHLRERSVLGVALGNGWYRGRLGWTGERALYGDELGVLAQLEIRFEDGHVQTVVTDEEWTSGPSGVLANDLYDGQTTDLAAVGTDWQLAGFEGASWGGVHAGAFDLDTLTPALGPPIRRLDVLPPVDVTTSKSGRTIVDFGQNLVGWVRLRVIGAAGGVVRIRHAEVLDAGELAIRPLRTAVAVDEYRLDGTPHTVEPTFTFHGFRYAEIDCPPGAVDPHAVEAVMIGSDVRRTGTFMCSDELVNRLHDNIVWSMRGNFVGLPTDCPQRDERLGWTGDIAVFAPTAAFLFDVGDFLRDWLQDLAAEQRAYGGVVPAVVPDVLKILGGPTTPPRESTAVWSDAAVWVPWAIWQATGDQRVLVEQFASMASHVLHVETLLSADGLWDTGYQWGDWLDPTAPPEDPTLAKAHSGVLATACLFRSARLVAAAARELGRPDAERFERLATRTRKAFTDHYVGPDGFIVSDAQTVYAMAIEFGLLDDEPRRLAGNRLSRLVRDGKHRIQTGFAGTPFIADALTTTGHVDDAYALLMQRGVPSWLYAVTMGATTVWERWDSMLPDGSVNPGEMTSFNHYALGAIADWMHRTIGGIAPIEPGYRLARIAPVPGGGLDWARSTLETGHGPIAVEWSVSNDTFSLLVDVPAEIDAEVVLPDGRRHKVGTGRHRFTSQLDEARTTAPLQDLTEA